MTIDEAIKVLKRGQNTKPIKGTENYFVALRLGIEALEAYRAGRDGDHYFNYPMLPGETSEPPPASA
ncbi:hypothetical protein ES705_31913 [subsurface metagenome]